MRTDSEAQPSYALAPVNRGPVVFLVLSHTMPQLLERLMSRLAETEDAVTVIHHDVKARELPSTSVFPRAHLVPERLDVGWGSMRIVEATLRSIEWVRREIPDYSWVVLISGQDYPVRAPRSIEAELLATDVDAYIPWEPVPRLPGRFSTGWQRGTTLRYFRRSIRSQALPGRVPRARALLDGVEVYSGAAWWDLSRRVIERIFEAEPFLTYLRRRFEPVVLPDEAFFQTAILNFPRELLLANATRRFYTFPTTGKSLHPHTLTIEHLPEIRASDAFFARKIDPVESADLLDALDQS